MAKISAQKGIVEMLDKKCKTVHRDRYGNGWVWNRRAELQYRVQMDTLERMMKDGYQHGLLKEISEPLVDRIEPLRFKELEDYINEHLGERIPRDTMRNEVTKRGHISNPKDRHKDKTPPSLALINRRLEDYEVNVISEQKWISSTERVRFWTLCKLH